MCPPRPVTGEVAVGTAADPAPEHTARASDLSSADPPATDNQTARKDPNPSIQTQHKTGAQRCRAASTSDYARALYCKVPFGPSGGASGPGLQDGQGAAPVCRAATCPSRSTSRVGMACAPNRCDTCGETSTFTSTN